ARLESRELLEVAVQWLILRIRLVPIGSVGGLRIRHHVIVLGTWSFLRFLSRNRLSAINANDYSDANPHCDQYQASDDRFHFRAIHEPAPKSAHVPRIEWSRIRR